MFALNDGIKAFDASLRRRRQARSATVDRRALRLCPQVPCRQRPARARRPTSCAPRSTSSSCRATTRRTVRRHLNAFRTATGSPIWRSPSPSRWTALVFMSGLFGANAVRSPLSDVPSTQGALGPPARGDHRERAAARHVRQRAPRAQRHAADDAARRLHRARVVIARRRSACRRHPPRAQRRPPRSAPCATSTAATRSTRSARSCSSSCRSSPRRRSSPTTSTARLAELRKVVTVALQPHVGDHVDIVLHHCRPISERNGFSAEIYPVADGGRRCVRRAEGAQRRRDAQLRPARRARRPGPALLRPQAALQDAADDRGRGPQTGQRSRAPQLGAPRRLCRMAAICARTSPSLGNEQAAPADAARASWAASRTTGRARSRFLATETTERERLEHYFDLVLRRGSSAWRRETYLGIAGDTFGAALAAADAFKAVQRTNRTLDRLIDEQGARGADQDRPDVLRALSCRPGRRPSSAAKRSTRRQRRAAQSADHHAIARRPGRDAAALGRRPPRSAGR